MVKKKEGKENPSSDEGKAKKRNISSTHFLNTRSERVSIGESCHPFRKDRAIGADKAAGGQ